jgi:hypothetical protein
MLVTFNRRSIICELRTPAPLPPDVERRLTEYWHETMEREFRRVLGAVDARRYVVCPWRTQP